jgi:cohesin complex subunit SA-1/2
MDQVLAQAKVKVSATSSTWEPQRAYERRLTNIMSKTKGLPPAHNPPFFGYADAAFTGGTSKFRARAASKPRESATTDEESGGQSGDDAAPQEPAPQRPQPRAAYRTRRTSKEPDAASASEDGEGRSEAEGMSPSNNKKRSSSWVRQTVSRSRSRSKRLRARSADASEGPPRSSPEGEITPKASRKRARAAARHEAEDEATKGREGEGEEGQGTIRQEETFPSERRASPSPARSVASRGSSAGASGEFHVRRKRARH